MSLSQNILNNVDTIVRSYISNISKKYNINESELVNLWYGNDTQIQSKESSEESNELSKLTKNEIIEMCKTKNIKVSGTKNELISRLLDCNKKTTTPQISITKKLIEKIPKIEIKKQSD
jgi:hypothetical protein